jgi:hypothetical protein
LSGHRYLIRRKPGFGKQAERRGLGSEKVGENTMIHTRRFSIPKIQEARMDNERIKAECERNVRDFCDDFNVAEAECVLVQQPGTYAEYLYTITTDKQMLGMLG